MLQRSGCEKENFAPPLYNGNGNGKNPSNPNVAEEPLKPQWEPEIIDSRDALAGMVINVPKKARLRVKQGGVNYLDCAPMNVHSLS
ncbi:hypothetical protein CEXT_468581 [Caerostris extrusa]|uniref:Uncharacterized protein n=1 Tax=Caerostris extrusa TaxID=172846 RepID=A0AAV4NXE3_CAEEX|nr:hypothetical protein CEXT_468581 [Caerostris extrusa]